MVKKIAIIGAGNIGLSLAKGLIASKKYTAKAITLTKRTLSQNDTIKKHNLNFTTNNIEAVKKNQIIIIAVLPQQLNLVLDEIKDYLNPKQHIIVSVVSGASSKDIAKHIGKKIAIIRTMPNTAIAIRQSMTCMASDNTSKENLELVKSIFDTVGETILIHEEMMTSATALNACGIAFFLRAIRAASQGGVEIGFHAEDALRMAVQTAKGAADLLLLNHSHPENEIDKVTSPKGCTIAGLNEMEHAGFSSALIKGIRISAKKAEELYCEE